MVLRIVSGVLCPEPGHRVKDKVTIDLRGNTVTPSNVALISDKCEWGGNSKYDKEPCKAVSIRWFDGNPKGINLTDHFKKDPDGTYAKVEIDWDCDGGEIKEITYFFAGEE